MFGLSPEDSLSEAAGKDMLKLTELVTNDVKNVAAAIINPDSANKDSDKKYDKKEPKKEDKN